MIFLRKSKGFLKKTFKKTYVCLSISRILKRTSLDSLRIMDSGIWIMHNPYSIESIIHNPYHIIHNPLWIMGLWIMDCGMWIMDYGIWIIHKPYSIIHNPYPIIHNPLWIMGLWIMDYGIWIIHNPYSISHMQWKSNKILPKSMVSLSMFWFYES